MLGARPGSCHPFRVIPQVKNHHGFPMEPHCPPGLNWVASRTSGSCPHEPLAKHWDESRLFAFLLCAVVHLGSISAAFNFPVSTFLIPSDLFFFFPPSYFPVPGFWISERLTFAATHQSTIFINKTLQKTAVHSRVVFVFVTVLGIETRTFYTELHHSLSFVFWQRDLLSCLSQAQTCDLYTSAFSTAGSTGVYYQNGCSSFICGSQTLVATQKSFTTGVLRLLVHL